jgi:hypothetical protein
MRRAFLAKFAIAVVLFTAASVRCHAQLGCSNTSQSWVVCCGTNAYEIEPLPAVRVPTLTNIRVITIAVGGRPTSPCLKVIASMPSRTGRSCLTGC